MSQVCAVRRLRHRSEVLRGNPLGDPLEREVLVLTPPGFAGEALPTVYWLAGFGSRGQDVLGGDALAPGMPELLGTAMHSGRIPRALLVLPDCTTRYGGSQYLDSPACGAYQSYLADELVPFVEAAFATLGPSRRAAAGKSSGGYGAIAMAMSRPGVFDSVCLHSPDAGFEFSYLSLLPRVLDTMAERGGARSFFRDPAGIVPKDAGYMVAMSLVAMAVCYAPEPLAELPDPFPCDPRDGRFRDALWRRWLEHDPVRLVRHHVADLSRLGLLFLDVGRHDEYAMHWGARALHAELAAAGVPHVYEEHDGGHHGIQQRYLRSLELLARHWDGRHCAA